MTNQQNQTTHSNNQAKAKTTPKNGKKTAEAINEEKTLNQELTAAIEEATTDDSGASKAVKGEMVSFVNETDRLIGEREYKLVANHREGFDAEKLGERYSEVLARYDYVVGDWGYEQLRLKGFFEADDRRAQPDQRIDTLQDYLYEFCNFGCAYFVIKRIGGKREKTSNRRRHPKRNPAQEASKAGKNNKPTATSGENKRIKAQGKSGKNSAHIKERREDLSKRHKPVITKREDKPTEAKKETNATVKAKTPQKGGKRGFVIKQREE